MWICLDAYVSNNATYSTGNTMSVALAVFNSVILMMQDKSFAF